MAAEAETLRAAPLFAGLGDMLAEPLMTAVTIEHHRRDATIFCEGEAGSGLYVVLDGRVALVTSDRHLESLVALLDPSDIFGELSLFDPGPRTTTAKVISEDATLARIARPAVMTWVGEHPEVSTRLLRVLARRLRRTNSTLRDLVFVDVPGRVAGVLVDLHDRYARSDGDSHGVLVSHGLTQSQLAQLVGASRETVNKALSDFTARSWVKLAGKGQLVINDLEALKVRAHRVGPQPLPAQWDPTSPA
jgi:CRP/FNR family transcriptional regulator